MASDFRTPRGRLKIEEPEKSVAFFLAANPTGTFSATELSQDEAYEIGNYFSERHNISHRKIAKTRSGVTDYRVDIKNPEKR